MPPAHLVRAGSATAGAMAQLVAHLLCKQGVRGSSPLGSTAGQRPFPFVGRGLCRVRTPEKYCSSPCGGLRRLEPAWTTWPWAEE